MIWQNLVPRCPVLHHPLPANGPAFSLDPVLRHCQLYTVVNMQWKVHNHTSQWINFTGTKIKFKTITVHARKLLKATSHLYRTPKCKLCLQTQILHSVSMYNNASKQCTSKAQNTDLAAVLCILTFNTRATVKSLQLSSIERQLICKNNRQCGYYRRQW